MSYGSGGFPFRKSWVSAFRYIAGRHRQGSDVGYGPNTILHLRNRLPCCDVRDCDGEGFDMGKPRKRGRAAEAPP